MTTLTQGNRKKGEKRYTDTQISRALKYFHKTSDEESSKEYYDCLLCQEELNRRNNLNGTYKGNLTSHLKNQHRKIYNVEIVFHDSPKYFALQRLLLLQRCTEITTVNKQPFADLLKSGFQKIIADNLSNLKKAGFGLDLRTNNLLPVKEQINKTAASVREHIKEEVKNRAIALMLDIGSKNHRSMLAISLQFIDDKGCIQVRSIGMIKLNQAHTGTYLTEELIKCLDVFGIGLRQIVAITTDNAANLGCVIRELNQICEAEIIDGNDMSDDFNNATSTQNETRTEEVDVEIVNIATMFKDDVESDENIAVILNQNQLADEEELDLLLDDSADYEALLAEMVANFQKKYGTSLIYISGVSCAAHTLQLSVKEAIERMAESHKNVISLCRNVAKFLRTQTSINEMTAAKLTAKFPRLDVQTRWSSTYFLVSRWVDSILIN